MKKKMVSILMAMTLMITPILALGQEASAFDHALASGKSLHAAITLLANEDLVGSKAAQALADLSFDMSFATEPAAQIALRLGSGENTLGDLMLEAGEGGEVYIRSTLLGEDVIRIDENDAGALLDKGLTFLVDSGMITAEEAQAIRTEIEAAPANEPAAEDEPAAQSIEINLSLFELMSMDFTPLMDAAAAIAGKIVITDGPHHPANADPASAYYGVSLTGEDLAALTDGVMKLIASSKTLTDMMDGAQLTSEQVAGMFAAVKTLDAGAYFAEDGTLVHLTILPVIAAEEGDLVGSIACSRRTEGEKLTLTLDLGAALDPVQGEYEVLFNIPMTLVLEENKATMNAELFGYKAQAVADLLEEQGESGTYSEMNLHLTVSNPQGEAVKGSIQFLCSECSPNEAYPIQAYSVTFALNDEDPLLGAMMTLSAKDPSGEALSAQPHVTPAQMTQDEFNALLKDLLMTLDAQFDAISHQEILPAA